ncbi:MAG: M23 family metallopeptidase [bacterium]|nr:M23 family metallopeptidase [bacterium]
MKKILLAGLLLLSGYTVSAQAVIHHRWPIDYFATPEASRWFDHTPQCGYLCRYDGAGNPGGSGHNGTDIRWNGTRTNVRTGAAGNIYKTLNVCDNNWGPSTDPCSGYGNQVRMEHADGKVTIYAHMEKGSVTRPLGTIPCGYSIGIMGNTGSSTATHLHLEMWGDRYTNPPVCIDHFGGAYSGLVYWVSQNANGYGKPSMVCE